MIVAIEFSSLQLIICAKQYELAHASIAGFDMKMIQYPYSMDIKMGLNEIVLRDVTPVGEVYKMHSEIVCQKASVNNAGQSGGGDDAIVASVQNMMMVENKSTDYYQLK